MQGSDKVLATFSILTSYGPTTEAALPSSGRTCKPYHITIHLPTKMEGPLTPFGAGFLHLECQSALAPPLTRPDPGPAALPVMGWKEWPGEGPQHPYDTVFFPCLHTSKTT